MTRNKFFLGWATYEVRHTEWKVKIAKWRVEIMEHVYEYVVSCSAFSDSFKIHERT